MACPDPHPLSSLFSIDRRIGAHAQVTIGNHFYKQIEGSYLVLEIEGAKLSSEVKLEPAAPVGSTEPHTKISEQLFPHLYGPINIESVVKELRVERKEDGTFLGLVGE